MITRSMIRLVLAFGVTTTLGAACGDDAVDLEPPVVQNQGAYTNENPLTLVGMASPGAEVQIRGGAEAVATGKAAGDGSFEVEVELRANAENTLFLSQTEGGTESTATVFSITHDDVAPDNPTVEPVATPTRRKVITLQGTAEADVDVVVSGGSEEEVATADAMGRFLIFAPIDTEIASVTERELAVQARDLAGNLSGATRVTVVHNPALPIEAPTLDSLPTHTNQAQLTVGGTTEPELEIQIVGSDTIDAAADNQGVFSASLSLEPNASNNVSVFALVSAIGIASPPAQFTIVHDDIAPDSPSLHPLPSPTGASTIRVSGTSEAFASIEVAGGASTESAQADSSGDFSVDVPLTPDSINSLSITATDRADNASVVAEASVEQDSDLDEPVLVDPQPSPTNASNITLTGTASAQTDVEIQGGAAAVTVTSEADGSFSATVPLNENTRNELRVRHAGGSSETLLIVDHDNIAPTSPGVDAIPSPTNQSNISVSGTSEPSASISVTGALSPANTTADTTGQFAVSVSIAEDATTSLLVIATDRAGNSSSATEASVTHSSQVPDAPVVDEQSPPPSSNPAHTITGHITEPGPGIEIRVSGGSAVATGATDEATGAFSLDVSLNANSLNTLEVTSIEGGIESPPSVVSITHDDIAPSDVDVNAVSLGSPTVSSCIARTEQISVNGGLDSAEAFATLRVENSSAGNLSSTTTVNSDGSFSTSILACEGDILRFTSTDAAGNSSVAVEKTVN